MNLSQPSPLATASNAWSLTGMFCNAVSYFASAPASPFENRLDEFGLIVSLAAASRLPLGSKPSRLNHRILWDLPKPYQPGGGLTINIQGSARSVSNLAGLAVSKHEKIIPSWPEDIKTAICLHLPKNLMEIDPEIATVKLKFCKEAIIGLKNLKKHTYADSFDGTKDQIKLCITYLKGAIKQIEEYESSKLLKHSFSYSPAHSAVEEKRRSIASDESKEDVELKDKSPLELSPDTSQALNPDSAMSREAIEGELKNLKRKEIQSLWEEKCLFQTLDLYFIEADSIPPEERESDETFAASLSAIDGILNQRGCKYEKILQKSLKY